MAKAKQKPLNEEWTDKVPPEVQEKADEYRSTLRNMGKLRGKLNSIHESTLAAMKKHGVKRLVIDEGQKVLVIKPTEKLRIEKRKLEKSGDGDEGRRRGRPRKGTSANGEAPAGGGKNILQRAAEETA